MGYYIKTAEGWREIPKECPNSNQLEGVYRPMPQDMMHFLLQQRCDRFCAALSSEAPGSTCGDPTQFRATEFIEPIFGAFGEKL